MKPIKITDIAAINAALEAANGRAQAHTFNDAGSLEWLANKAEAALQNLGLPKAARAGAAWVETSGAAVSSSYDRKGHKRAATRVRLERTKTGWVLTSAEKTEIYKSGGGQGRLILTPAQDAEAVRRLRTEYSVAA